MNIWKYIFNQCLCFDIWIIDRNKRIKWNTLNQKIRKYRIKSNFWKLTRTIRVNGGFKLFKWSKKSRRKNLISVT